MTNEGETTVSLDDMKNLSRRLYIEVFGKQTSMLQTRSLLQNP
jgi:hypothetical protein